MALIENPELTRQYIIQALFALMESCPYGEISITDIVKKAGIGRATFYRHFKTKEDVLREYFLQGTLTYWRNLSCKPVSEDDYYEFIFNAFSQLKENRVAIERLIKAHLEFLFLDYLNEAMVENFEQHRYNSTRYAPYYMVGSLFNVSIQWVKNGCAESVRKITEDYFSLTAKLLAE